ncbi:TrkH family potassium uptake protein [Roseburia sp. 499]|uniref:TrkH family potassium uptake protein n=1 Tax=Roseburia sp. 499 TaxID=1261634 RepID=UPI000952BDB1|nr:TrkH family potassium uptake protein [Roseburia sp. 499]WVK70934.1 TrkH family potassium uptake protein [Roseburia sp. 499]
MNKKMWYQLSYTRIIALSFILVILTGSILLSLPIATKSGQVTPFGDAVFTATSATCVTGLVVHDTFTYWSTFGQIVILVMIQIGGIGLMTIITMMAVFLKRKISIHERRILMQSAGNMRMSGVVKLIKSIMLGTFVVEGIGAVILAICFHKRMGLGESIYYGIFHSISAFCNAGFDLMGKYEPCSSFTSYETDVVVNIVIMALIIVGGIGFWVWNEIVKHKFRFRDYSLHAKLVLVTTGILLLAGTIGYYILERGNMGNLNEGQKWMSSMFMSVTTRTAGFNTRNLEELSQSGQLLTMILMFIGGSPGSTAGGIKTTTLAAVVLMVQAMGKGRDNVTVFKKRLESSQVRQACTIVVAYITGVLAATMLICFVEHTSMSTILFESISAIGTVGLSLGITSTLGMISKIILIVLMFGGRIGALSFLLLFGERKKEAPLKRPEEKILIG